MTALHHSIRRLTVSAYELGCLGLLHGTRARARRALGRPDPEPVSLTQEMLKRPTNGSLEVKPAWPRDLAIITVASIAAAGMIAVVAAANPTEAPAASPPTMAASVEVTPAMEPPQAPLPSIETTAVITKSDPEPPAKKAKKVKKAKKAKKKKTKKRRGRKRGRRRR